jgi:hypothetical protein
MIQKTGDWISAQVGDELVMMSVASGKYIGLGGVGGRIWELLEQPRSENELCGLLLAEFDVADDVCRAEVAAFLAQLERHGAVAHQ